MVARLVPAQEHLKLTQENHPENAALPVKPPSDGLTSTIAIGALCGLVGMIFGTAALSTALASDSAWEVISLIPMAVMAVCILSGWVGAFYWMCREESTKHGP
jgi:hypothetical protein